MQKIRITFADRKKYVLKTKQDERILLICKRIEQKKLTAAERHQVAFIKSQLLDDWRTPLEKEARKNYHKILKLLK